MWSLIIENVLCCCQFELAQSSAMLGPIGQCFSDHAANLHVMLISCSATASNNCSWIFDRSLQAMWRYSQCRHHSCNNRQSLAIAMYRTVEYENKKQYFWNSVARLCLSLNIRWRHWEYCHMACGAMFLVAESISKETPHIFVPKRWNRFFAIYVVRLALYVCLKYICDGVGRQNGSNSTPHPPLFWLDNIFKESHLPSSWKQLKEPHVPLRDFVLYLMKNCSCKDILMRSVFRRKFSK